MVTSKAVLLVLTTVTVALAGTHSRAEKTEFEDKLGELAAGGYIVGTGRGDVTGPSVQVNMMGYANPAQISAGIHIRMYSRAFLVADRKNPKKRIVFVNVDTCMGGQLVKLEVLKQLRSKYGSLYTDSNICLSGIHTHSSTAGFLQYVLYDITSFGFVKESFDALVSGIVKSIEKAHDSAQPGDIYVNSGTLLNTSINRSPTAYENNPKEERAKYAHNVDKEMTVLKLVDSRGAGVGMVSWFAVHGTSMNNTNTLLSGDNKGYAAQLFEKDMDNGSIAGQGKFVAAFAQSNEGDVSPNTKGPMCVDTGLPCDRNTSTCNGKTETCIAFGPGDNMTESTRIIGYNQYTKAMELYQTATTKLSGRVDHKQRWVDMTNQTVTLKDGRKVNTCKAAMGYSFAAGTTDGPGAFDFHQGATTANPFWNVIVDLIKKPSVEQEKCQEPKPILLDIGEIDTPYKWGPDVTDTQIFQIGQLVGRIWHSILIAVPGEFTTMSGRRTRDAIKQALVSKGYGTDTIPVIAGLANTYADYIATNEEYQVQRYEGGSTVYGPWTLDAFIQNFVFLAEALADNTTVTSDVQPPNLLNKQISLVPPVLFDKAPFGKEFGDVTEQPKIKYDRGDTARAVFVAANPRNDLQLEGSYLTIDRVDRQQSMETNVTVYTDASWETRFKWAVTSMLLGESHATIEWDIPTSVRRGFYRITHTGHYKNIFQQVTKYHGATIQFLVN